MPRPAPDPALVQLCLEQVAAGTPLREIAEVAGVSAMTISRWAKDRGVAAGGVQPAPAPAPQGEPASEADLLDTLRRMLGQLLDDAKSSRAVGNMTAVTRSMRDAGNLSNTIARIEGRQADDADVLRISRSEIAEAMAAVTLRVQAIADRPLLCAHCSRALSVSFGERGAEPAPE